MGKSDQIKQYELDGIEWFQAYEELIPVFTNAGWESIFHRFNGYNVSWCHDFIHSFDGSTARVRDLEFAVTEESITKAKGLSTEGEKWFQKQMVQNVDLNFFLK